MHGVAATADTPSATPAATAAGSAAAGDHQALADLNQCWILNAIGLHQPIHAHAVALGDLTQRFARLYNNIRQARQW